MSKKTPDSKELLHLLRSSMLNNEEVVPAGWKTAMEWGREWKLGESMARRLLAAGEKKGVMESRFFRIKANKYLIRKVMHYKAI